MLAWWRRRALAHKARQSRTGGRTDPLIRRARRPSRKGLMIGSDPGGRGPACENTPGPTPHQALGLGGRSHPGRCRPCGADRLGCEGVRRANSIVNRCYIMIYH